MIKKISFIFIVTLFSCFMLSLAPEPNGINDSQFIKTTYNRFLEINTVIETKDDLIEFYEEYNDEIFLGRREKVYSDSTIGFLDAIDKYDEKYFENNDLIIVYFTSSSGSYYYELRNIKVGENIINIDINRKAPGPHITFDMVGWLLIVEKEKSVSTDKIEINIHE